MAPGARLAIGWCETKQAKARSRRDRWASQRDFVVLESLGRIEESHGLAPWIVRLHATEAADKNTSFFPALKSRWLARRRQVPGTFPSPWHFSFSAKCLVLVAGTCCALGNLLPSYCWPAAPSAGIPRLREVPGTFHSFSFFFLVCHVPGTCYAHPPMQESQPAERLDNSRCTLHGSSRR